MTSFRKLTVVILTGIVTLGLAVVADYSLLLHLSAATSDYAMGGGMTFYSYHY